MITGLLQHLRYGVTLSEANRDLNAIAANLAKYLPARRAARVEPMVALRYE